MRSTATWISVSSRTEERVTVGTAHRRSRPRGETSRAGRPDGTTGCDSQSRSVVEVRRELHYRPHERPQYVHDRSHDRRTAVSIVVAASVERTTAVAAALQVVFGVVTAGPATGPSGGESRGTGNGARRVSSGNRTTRTVTFGGIDGTTAVCSHRHGAVPVGQNGRRHPPTSEAVGVPPLCTARGFAGSFQVRGRTLVRPPGAPRPRFPLVRDAVDGRVTDGGRNEFCK